MRPPDQGGRFFFVYSPNLNAIFSPLSQMVDRNAYLESTEHYRLLMENIEDYAILTIDTDGIIRSWNVGAERMLLYKKREAVGQNISMFFTEEDRAQGAHIKELEAARTSGKGIDERWHVRKDGSRFWGSGLVVCIKEGDELIGFAKVFRDRTKEREQEIRKDEFVALASHEFRTPLSIIKISAELLSAIVDAKKDPEITEAVQQINEQTDRLTHLVNDLLDLSKIMSGKLTSNKAKIDIRDVVVGVVDDYRSLGILHSVELLQSDRAIVYADKDQMIQVLQNLISNAIRYSPEAERVELWIRKTGRQVTVYVRDYGVGISKKDIDKIFQRFYQVEGKKKVSGGLGVGLYVCFEIIKQHAGSIGVTSEGEGTGSTFYFTLPLAT